LAIESTGHVDAATHTASARIASLTDLVAIQSRESGRTNTRVSLLSVSFLTDSTVLARIESARLTGGDAPAVGGITNKFVSGRTDH
jgi:hypothetical protein